MAKLLLVEDDEMNRDMLSRRLKRKGFELLLASDGQEAVDKALSEAPDLVLMDMSLPVLDGWAATRQLRQSEASKSLPVIALTAHAMAGDREGALRLLDAYPDPWAPIEAGGRARIHALLDQKKLALDWLEKAVAAGYRRPKRDMHDPAFDQLVDDARYLDLLLRMK